MAEQKLFAGPRLKRVRKGLGKTQSAMAEELGISPSYLALIETNSRPLTVQLLLKLASTYGLDVAELQGTADAAQVTSLKAVFADPLLEGEVPDDTELMEIAEVAPNVMSGIVKLHRAYNETRERLSELSRTLDAPVTGGPGPLLPIDVVREAFASRPYSFPLLEEAVERFAVDLPEADDLFAALRQWLVAERGVTIQVLPRDLLPNGRRRFDRHGRRLFLSERLSRPKQLETVAQEVLSFAARDAIREELALMRIEDGEATRLAGQELARFAALALLMPYRRALDAARGANWDVEAVATRFGVTFAQGARRLSSLQDGSRGRSRGVPLFLMEIDHAGNVVRRQGGFREGFPAARFGGACPKLPVFEAFAEPGRTRVEAAQTPAGERFLLVARSVDGPRAAVGERVRRTAFLLGFEWETGLGTAYAGFLPREAEPIGIGPTCRLCERVGCLARAAPPVSRPAHLEGAAAGIGPYSFS